MLFVGPQVWRRAYDVPPPPVTEKDATYPGNDPRYKVITWLVLSCCIFSNLLKLLYKENSYFVPIVEYSLLIIKRCFLGDPCFLLVILSFSIYQIVVIIVLMYHKNQPFDGHLPFTFLVSECCSCSLYLVFNNFWFQHLISISLWQTIHFCVFLMKQSQNNSSVHGIRLRWFELFAKIDSSENKWYQNAKSVDILSVMNRNSKQMAIWI